MTRSKPKHEARLFSGGMVLMLLISAAAIWVTVIISQMEGEYPKALFNAGIDLLGAAVCAVMYYGCLADEKAEQEASTRAFIMLILLCGVCFLRNLCIWYVDCIQGYRSWYVFVTALGNSADLLLVYAFYRYVCTTLEVRDALARWSGLAARVLLIFAVLLTMSSCFGPVTFWVDQRGGLQNGALYWIGDCYVMLILGLFFAALFTSTSPKSQKLVASSFVVIPTINYAISMKFMGSGTLYATQYASILVALVLIRNVLFAERSKKMAASRAELRMAAGIQAHMLPSIFPAFSDRKEFDIYATMDPAKEVGGDFYDFFMIGDDHLGMVVADVSGKGVPAALFSMIAKTMLKTQAQTRLSPERVLLEVNASLSENNEEDMFVTVWLGVLEISTGELTYADAGHEKLLLYQDGAWKFLPKAGGVALAMWEPEDLELTDERYLFSNQTVHLNPGDAIFQYTDGVTEATDADNVLFGDDRLLAAMNSAPSAKPEELLPHVRAKIDEFVKDAPQFDDITMLGLQYKGTEQE